jgi:hypothetical protein
MDQTGSNDMVASHATAKSSAKPRAEGRTAVRRPAQTPADAKHAQFTRTVEQIRAEAQELLAKADVLLARLS